MDAAYYNYRAERLPHPEPDEENPQIGHWKLTELSIMGSFFAEDMEITEWAWAGIRYYRVNPSSLTTVWVAVPTSMDPDTVGEKIAERLGIVEIIDE